MAYHHPDGLTSFQRRMYALADMPESLRDQALASSSETERKPLNSLNNVTADAYPSGERVCRLSEMPRYSGKVSGPASFLLREDPEWSQSQKRSIMESYLREWFPGLKWSTSLWDFIGLYKEAAVGVFQIWDSIYKPYRGFNFRLCYAPKTRGWVYTNIAETEDRYRQRIRCCEPGCLDCRDTTRRTLAAEWLEIWKKIIEKHPGCCGVLEIIPTLPAEVEALPLENPAIAKKYQDELHRLIWKIFGLSSCPRPNVLCHFSVHPIGDKDLFRDRYHVHIDILPGHIVKGPEGQKSFKWLSPARIAAGHTNFDWKIDLDWLCEEYNALLRRVFGESVPAAICPQVMFTPYSEKSYRYKKAPEQKEQRFWRTVGHKLKYSMRGFGRDIEKAVLRSDMGTGLCVLKAQRGGMTQWQISPVRGVAERFKWIKEKNSVRTRGFGQCLKKYSDVLGFDVDQPGEVPEVIRADASVRIVREKRYDRKAKKVKWVRDEFYKWLCPVTGELLEKSKEELKPWKGEV